MNFLNSVFSFVFYIFIIFPFIWETLNLSKPRKIIDLIQSSKGKKFEELTDAQKWMSVCLLGYLLWSFVGLFTSQWVVVLFLFIIGFIPKLNVVLRVMDALITLICLLFIILNKYHLHIDLYQVILNYFS